MANPMKSPKISKRIRKLRIAAEKVAPGPAGRAAHRERFDDIFPKADFRDGLSPPSTFTYAEQFLPAGSVQLMYGSENDLTGGLNMAYLFGDKDGQVAVTAPAPWLPVPF